MVKYRKLIGLALIAIVVLTALVSIFVVDPVAQDPAYHHFADTRKLWGIPNFWNVLSNLPFLIVGLMGVYQLTLDKVVSRLTEIKFAYPTLFLGVALVGLGSSYYHLWPDNRTLLWDRLPMTVAFMALFTIIISEFGSVNIGRRIFTPLLIAGVGSVLYWHFGESRGHGDLRFYLLVQFLPILLIPVFLLCFPSRFNYAQAYWWLLLSYIIAKLLEHFDAEVFALTGFLSGHSLKHIVAAIGLYILLYYYRRRDYKTIPAK